MNNSVPLKLSLTSYIVVMDKNGKPDFSLLYCVLSPDTHELIREAWRQINKREIKEANSEQIEIPGWMFELEE